MFHVFVLICLCCWSLIVSVMEGDSVTLYIDDTEIHEKDNILWTYGAENSLIAIMNREDGIFFTYDSVDGRFRDRLKLDDQTGSLTITNITTEHAGDYQLEISGAKLTKKTFSVSVYGVFGDSVSVMEGDSVTLYTDLTKIMDADLIRWRFETNDNLEAKIIVQAYRSTVYDDVTDERFRDRLKPDDQTGSLTITNITTEHAGVYEQWIRSYMHWRWLKKRFIVSVYARLPVPVISSNSSQCSSS
ncbi:uncharacterized protein LOC125263455, partial [Megalobrama amblycephala]|uniref:uncharacterized protein LOC125263455 n=1 Tax=Megalobrama amblycephala TaxID=75352 RepID=UPI002014019C